MKYIVFFFSLVILSSCSNNKYVDVSDVNIDSELIRFDSLFYNVENIDGLTSLKKAYPLMFSEETNDTVWMNKVSDIEEQKVFQKSVTVFGDFNKQYSELVDLFKHVKYFYPEFNSPDVFTILSDFDYQYPVLYTQDRLFVSLDMYLGVDEEEYEMFPK